MSFLCAALSASTPASTKDLFDALGLGTMLDDPRFATNDARVRHNDLVDEALSRAFGERTLDELMHLAETRDLTLSPVYDAADIAKDPHVVARGLLVDLSDRDLGSVRMPAPTPRLTETPAAIRGPAPALGEHTAEILREIGIDDAEIETLRRDGVV